MIVIFNYFLVIGFIIMGLLFIFDTSCYLDDGIPNVLEGIFCFILAYVVYNLIGG